MRQVLFYIPLFLFVFACNYLFSGGYDNDLWARLIAGKSVVQNFEVLKQDFLSYTPTHVWYDHEWGSGVIFYLTLQLFGSQGILVLQGILIFLILFFISRIVKLRGVENTTPYNFLYYLVTLSLIIHLVQAPIRCQLFTFLLFSIFLYLLERMRMGDGNDRATIIAMPLLMILWNNLHGGCISGIGLLAIYIGGELLNKKPVRKFSYALIGCIVVLPLNPWGFEYLPFLFNASTMPRPDIVEWWGLFSPHNTYGFTRLKIIILIMILLETYLWIRGRRNQAFHFDYTKFLLLGITLWLSLEHIKMIPFLVISGSVFLYNDFYRVFNSITRNFFNRFALPKDVAVYSIAILFSFDNILNRRPESFVDFQKYPVLSTEFLKINGIKGNLLTNFGIGSYAAYKLYPGNRIFMDGRYEEVYYDYMMDYLRNFHILAPGWDMILQKFPPDSMILEKYYPVYMELQKSPEWILVYDEDPNFGVFIRRKDLREKYLEPTKDPDYYRNTIFDTAISFR